MSFKKKSDWINTSLSYALALELQRMDDGIQNLFEHPNVAEKLSRPVNINGVSFDGSEDIKVTADPTSNLLTYQNLDAVFAPGLYYAPSGNAIQNKPSNVDSFGLSILQIASNYYLQELVSGNTLSTKGRKYFRTYDGYS